MRKIAAITVVLVTALLLCSCSSVKSTDLPITDGFSCTVNGKYDGNASGLTDDIEMKISICADSFNAKFVAPKEVTGLSLSMTAAGQNLSFDGASISFSGKLPIASIATSVCMALRHKYTPDEYKSGKFVCSDDCGDFEVTMFKNRLISTIKFSSLDYTCYFNYQNS